MYFISTEDTFSKSNLAGPRYIQAVDTDTSPLRMSIAILYRDQSDIAVIKDVFGEALQSVAPFTFHDPAALTDFLSTQTVRSCFIIVEAGEIIKEIQKKSGATPYEDLLRTARRTVGKNASFLSRSSREGRRLSSTKAVTRTSSELGQNYLPSSSPPPSHHHHHDTCYY